MSQNSFLGITDVPSKVKNALVVTPILEHLRNCNNIATLESLPYCLTLEDTSPSKSCLCTEISSSITFKATKEQDSYLIYLCPPHTRTDLILPSYRIRNTFLLKLYQIKSNASNTLLTNEDLLTTKSIVIKKVLPAVAQEQDWEGVHCLVVTEKGKLIAE